MSTPTAIAPITSLNSTFAEFQKCFSKFRISSEGAREFRRQPITSKNVNSALQALGTAVKAGAERDSNLVVSLSTASSLLADKRILERSEGATSLDQGYNLAMGKVEKQLVTPLKKILAALNKLLLTPEEVAPVT